MQSVVDPFNYMGSASRILFGEGRTRELAAEIDRLGATRAFVITTPGQRETGAIHLAALGSVGGALFDGAVMHTPTEVTEIALVALSAARCDVLVAIGGGSTIGLAKALALRTGLPQIAIPTSYAGSEVTAILGETTDGSKKTQRGAEILPEVVIYDVTQTLSLAPATSAASGLNAIAHACEALYTRAANPITSLMAVEGIAALARSLPTIVIRPDNISARTDAQYGAWLCGTCLGTVGMAIHHKLCHVLGGSFDLPHAETHAIMLPYSLAYNASAAPGAMARIASALGTSDQPSTHLYAMLRTLGLPTSLAAIGMPEDGLPGAVEQALRDSYWNPRPLEAAPLRRLFDAAYAGDLPTSF